MKTKVYILLILGVISFMACSKETPIDDDNQTNSDSGRPAACMMVVKFADQEQLDYVIAQHPIKSYNSLFDNTVQYFTDTVLVLSRPINQTLTDSNEVCSWKVFDSGLMNFLEDELAILDRSPYVPLTDNYYLIDWRWIDLLSLSVLVHHVLSPQLYTHIHKHTFITDTKWTELASIEQCWDRTKYTVPVNVEEVYRIGYEVMDRFLNQYDRTKSFPGLNYYDYYCAYVTEAYGFHQKDKGMAEGTKYSNIPWNYQQYLSFRDSLQNSYQQCLIEIIQNNQLKEVSNEY